MSRIRTTLAVVFSLLMLGALMGSDSACFFTGEGFGGGGGAVIIDD